jgi:hypothetical protein
MFSSALGFGAWLGVLYVGVPKALKMPRQTLKTFANIEKIRLC